MQIDDDGQIDWTRGQLRVVGVGTPRVLSPSGGITDGDPYQVAVTDARRRLARLLERVRLDAQGLYGRRPALSGAGQRALEGFTSEGARRFSDGTVHVPAALSLDWLPAAVGEPPAPEDPSVFTGPPLPPEVVERSADLPTGLILTVEGALPPSTRLRLAVPPPAAGLDGGPPPTPAPAQAAVYVGWLGDAAGTVGLRWFHAGDPAIEALVGARPVRLTAAAQGPGRVQLADAASVARLAGVQALPAAVVLQ